MFCIDFHEPPHQYNGASKRQAELVLQALAQDGILRGAFW
ncbi:hypothetical Protein YC6258_03430 [Gynuella sunshinyii YC6258]|uniref:Uncharacterized protein n=1 Tax=Gynuella sunshinyii YC6258 TaxID=1445510 RepID=A0A0C5VMC5_9GAMM|nr:hypothetical Protein YC6258_03430 [Gynuella sunshinyii YC6258]